MDQLLFHPRVVHLPLALAVLTPLVAGGIGFAWWRGWLDRRAWVVVFALQGVLVGSGLMAMYTGEEREERVGLVAEHQNEPHEEAAEIFLWASVIVLALMGVPLVLREGELRDTAVVTACIGSLLALVFATNAYLTPTEIPPDRRFQAIDEYEDDADSDE